ncbi:28S ribosomal protein S9, mitochondrial [Macrosteles quadrilineatus]|uniref:28S ribosomal protein S9, mitochondrial n=1 Tax=Macrosteles quadrilineatus TaxID=74068 RepID=UPI0023E24496|nr:28S ribosomal protein S9, mitochondrial [Macrosteles quadrilineatus]
MFTVKNIVFSHTFSKPIKLCSALSKNVVLQEHLVTSIRKLSITKCLREQNDDQLVEHGIKEEKSSKAMRAYLERSQAYNKFMEQEEVEFKTGKRHLANMMGKDPETFTQKDVDEAIAYLFPSALFVKKTRPLMKPPAEVHPPKKEAEFDETGRPHHYLFYTGKPNLYEYLHKLVDVMIELNSFEDTMIRKQLKPDPALTLSQDGYQWLSKEEFEQKFLEKITGDEHRQLISTLDRLLAHPYSYRVEKVFLDARKTFTSISADAVIPKPELQPDGREFVKFEGSKRKTAFADATVRFPGTGKIDINGFDLSYFQDLHTREQLLFPLHFTGMLNQVDIEAKVRGGGYMAQARAIRYAVSMALRSFV